MQTIIMAGGKGTRVASIASDIPKPMIPICNKPILEHQIEVLKKNGLVDIIIGVGHLGHIIKDYFGDGSRFGCYISYYTETEPLGTAGVLYKLNNLSEDFIVLNGDIMFDMDFFRMIAFHREKRAFATLAVHPNNHPFDSSLIVSNNNGQVTSWLNKEDERIYYKNQVNAGIHILSTNFLKICPQKKEKIDLDRDMLKPSIPSGRTFCYQTPEYIKDMGTPERYSQVTADIESGLVKGKNLNVKQKAIFLDRDGTINILNGFINKPEDFVLIDGVAEAIQKINSLGFLAIVITNQPVIARGEIDFETLDLIHKKMETDLGKLGAYIDDLFFCPHHIDKGFPGERPEYKIDCDCRKPKPGMLFKAAQKYNIDLSKSYMVGDDMRDVQAGINAGCTPVFLTNNEIIEEKEGILQFPNLLNFVKLFLCLCLFIAGCSSNPEINIRSHTENSVKITVPAKHLVFIGLDGWGGAYVANADMPSVKHMIANGSSSFEVYNVKPSTSWPNWTSLFSGTPPENRNSEQFSSIFTVIGNSEQENTSVLFCEWDELQKICQDETVEKLEIKSDLASAQKAAAFFMENKPVFTAVVFDEPDGTGHSKRWGSKAYYTKLNELDTFITIIEQAVKEAGVYDSTVFILSSDHGGSLWGHRYNFIKNRMIPLVVFGCGIKEGFVIPSPISICDIAPTMATILGLEAPSEWSGNTLSYIFK